METVEQIAVRDGTLAAHTWMAGAKRRIDEEFGEGFAAANPAVVAAFMQAAALSHLADRVANVIADLPLRD